jgi:hypothetical protein
MRPPQRVYAARKRIKTAYNESKLLEHQNDNAIAATRLP